MMEWVTGVLSDPKVQTVVVLFVVAVVQSATSWIKAKFPTQAKLVEDNWCYIQPFAEAALKQSRELLNKSSLSSNAAYDIITKMLDEFVQSYRDMEGKEPTAAVISAARKEIEAVVMKTLP